MTHSVRAESIIPQLSGWLFASSFPNWFYVALMAGVFLILALATLIALHDARRQRRRYADLNTLHATLVQRYYDLLARTGHVEIGDGEDRDELSRLAGEIADTLDYLDHAEAVNVCSFPAPAIEIEYPDYLVTLSLAIDRHEPEEDESSSNASNGDTSAVGSGATHGIH